MPQRGVVVTIADLAHDASESLANMGTVAVADVVVLLFVRLPSGEYLEAATRQVSWQDWLIKNMAPGPSPLRQAERREAENGSSCS